MIFSKKTTFAHFKELFETSSTQVSVCPKNVPVSRKKQLKIDFFESFCQFMRRWDQISKNQDQENDQWKILNKIGPFGATFERFLFRVEKNDNLWIDFRKSKSNVSKVAPNGLILFRIFHWSFLWSPFWSIWSHLRINWQKLSKNRPKWPFFGLNFLETGIEIEKTLQSNEPPLFDDF